jgi:tetratricopeptide (TPR) repeat protein
MASALDTAHPFIGRLDAVESLNRQSEDTLAGHGGVTFLVGETGVGKSTLIGEIVARARAHGIQVLEGRAPALEDPPPFLLIREALQSVQPMAPPLAGGERSDPSRDTPPVPASEAVFIGFAPGFESHPPSESVEVEERLLHALTEAGERTDTNRERLLTRLADQFLVLTSRGPTMLVLDDLHLADDSSLGCVEYLASQFENRPLWILASVRAYASLPEERRERLERLERATHANRIVVRPFTSAELADFVRILEPDRPTTAEQIARWHSETGGNPLFLAQILRLRREGAAPLDRGEIPTAASLSEFLASTLPGLDEEAQRVVAVASVLGNEFPFAQLLGASGEEEERLAEITDRLVGRGVLIEHPDEQLAFVSSEVRDQIYAGLTETRRRLLHRNVAVALESAAPIQVETIYALARHFYLGKVDEKAVQYNRMAADFAIRTFSPLIAREHLERALDAHQRAYPKDARGEIDLTLELAIQLDYLGELQTAEQLLRKILRRRAVHQREMAAQEILVELYLVRVLSDQGAWMEAERNTRELESRIGPETSALTQIAFHRLRGEALFYLGRYPEALAEHDAALTLARAIPNEREIALEEVRRGTALSMMPGRMEEAIQGVNKGAQALEALGDQREASFAHIFLGATFGGEGRFDDSAREFRRALELGEQAHDPRRVGWSRFNLADILREQKQFDEALDQNRRSRQILERIGDRFALVQTMIIQGKILLDQGRLNEAEVELLDAFRLVRELKTPADEVDVVLRLAQLAWARGDRVSAERRVEELERQGIDRLRPDISGDFARLKKALSDPRGAAANVPS